MQQALLLMIDEVTMEHRYLYECLDHSLQDVRGNNKPFGGLTILFSGDWKQILPVVKRGSQAQVRDATLKKNHTYERTYNHWNCISIIVYNHCKTYEIQTMLIIYLKLEMD